MLYIASMSFQLAGGLALLLDNLNIREQIFKLYSAYATETIHEINENGMVKLNKELIRDITENIFISIFTFIDLLIGYTITIWCEKTFNNIQTYIGIFAFTSIIIGIECSLSKFLSKLKCEKNVLIPYEKFPDSSNFYREL